MRLVLGRCGEGPHPLFRGRSNQHSKIMNINEALGKLMSTRKWYIELDISKVNAHKYKNRFKKDELSLEKKIEILSKAGIEIDEINVK